MIECMDTERLLLRKVASADAKSLWAIWSDPAVTKFMNISTFTNEEQVLEMIKLLNQLANEHTAIRYSIIEKTDNNIVGSCGFNNVDFDNATAEIGYDLAKTHWGKGYATEAIIALIDVAFTHLEMTTIVAKVDAANINSIKVLQKLNFTLQGYDSIEENLQVYVLCKG
ncbi:GNAT family N-acetyltransferase [Lysinibacillus fusiformis]|uniref:GNAT family N-acetyltransferase n=1 Tax=Lysinibacillus fusiformis TaxID=28031 RepID=UPI001E2A3628|nr:GNAT family N-acetyltransferase [Lysinibacillus fusiformis]